MSKQQHDIGCKKRLTNELEVRRRAEAQENRAQWRQRRSQKRETPSWVDPITYTADLRERSA